MQLSVFFLWSHSFKILRNIFQNVFCKYDICCIHLKIEHYRYSYSLQFDFISHLSPLQWKVNIFNETAVDFTILHLHIVTEERRLQQKEMI